MSPFLTYLIKVSLIYILCYLLYWVLFRKETFFSRNRLFLLISLVIPAIIPLIHFHESSPVSELVAAEGMTWIMVVSNVLTEPASTAIIPKISEVIEPVTQLNRSGILLWIYLGGLFFFLIRMIFNYARIISLIAASEKKTIVEMILVITMAKVSPFSLFKWLVIPKNKENYSDLDKIIRHEMIHYKQNHSIDLLLSEILIAFQWFNPFAWLLKSAVIKNNEFLVDQKLMSDYHDQKAYQYALLTSSFGERKLAMVNSFNRGLIKKRIIMMNKRETPIINRIKNILILPFAIVIILAFSAYSNKASDSLKDPQGKKGNSESWTLLPEKVRTEISGNTWTVPQNQERKVVENEKRTVVQDQDQDKKKKKKSEKNHIKIYVDGKMVTLKNVADLEGEGGDIKILSRNDTIDIIGDMSKKDIIKLVESAEGEDGHRIIMVKESKDGEREVDVYVGAIMTDEGEEGSSGVVFLEHDGDSVQIISGEGHAKSIILKNDGGKGLHFLLTDDDEGKEMLFVLDGKIVDTDVLSDIEPDGIYKIEVLKSGAAVEEFGKKGKNGVVKITTKKR